MRIKSGMPKMTKEERELVSSLTKEENEKMIDAAVKVFTESIKDEHHRRQVADLMGRLIRERDRAELEREDA